MRYLSWVERLGAATLVGRETPLERRVVRWLWAGVAVSLILGFLAPIYPEATRPRGAAPIGASVLVMLAVSLATRRPLICLTMSAFGIVAGSALGFGLIAVLTHRAISFASCAQMAVGAVLLGRLFVRELRPPALPLEDLFWEEIRSLPKEEANARVKGWLETSAIEVAAASRRLKRISLGTNLIVAGSGVALLGGAIMIAGGHVARHDTAGHFAFPALVLGLAIALFGARTVKAG